LPQPEDRRQFVADFARSFLVSAELGQWSPLEQTIREWRNTAAVHADHELAASLATPVDAAEDVGPVPRPTQT